MDYRSHVAEWRKLVIIDFSFSLCSCSAGLVSRGSVLAGEADHRGAVWSLHLDTNQGATLKKQTHTYQITPRTHIYTHVTLSILPTSLIFYYQPASALSFSCTHHITANYTQTHTCTQAHKMGWGWDYLGLLLPEVGGAHVCPAAYWWIFLQLSSLMFKEVVQIKATCTIIWFDFIIVVLIVVVVVVFILTKGNAFMYGFVMIILSPRGRLLHAVALRACFWDKILISLPVCLSVCPSFLMASLLSLSFLSFSVFRSYLNSPNTRLSADFRYMRRKLYNVPQRFGLQGQIETVVQLTDLEM